jgi:uncharacterized protein YdcH (DUF465 family)
LPPPEPVADAIQEPLRQVFVVTSFQSVSEFGTHDFPAGTKVNLLAEEGEEYLVEFEGVSVKNNKSFFSETEVVVAPVATPEPSPLAPLPTPEPPAALSPEDQKVSELSDKIRLLDEEVRAAKEKSASGEPSKAEAREIERLKKQRNQLSEELSTISKP